VLVTNISPKECVKADPILPVYGRFYGARQNHPTRKRLPEETTTALKTGRTFTQKIVCYVNIEITLSPIF
jgi:hypothetical protein